MCGSEGRHQAWDLQAREGPGLSKTPTTLLFIAGGAGSEKGASTAWLVGDPGLQRAQQRWWGRVGFSSRQGLNPAGWREETGAETEGGAPSSLDSELFPEWKLHPLDKRNVAECNQARDDTQIGQPSEPETFHFLGDQAAC